MESREYPTLIAHFPSPGTHERCEGLRSGRLAVQDCATLCVTRGGADAWPALHAALGGAPHRESGPARQRQGAGAAGEALGDQGRARRVTIVEGPPASGKSVLVRQLAAEAVRRGVLVLVVPVVRLAAIAVAERRGAPHEQRPALHVFVQTCLRAVQEAIALRECVFLFDGLDEAGDAEVEARFLQKSPL